MTEVQIFPLVSNLALPKPAPVTTRSPIPQAMVCREQCLPFTAATALGFPLSPRLPLACACRLLLPDGHAFRSPLDRPHQELLKTSVLRAIIDAAAMSTMPIRHQSCWPSKGNESLRGEPGISFFDRMDQLVSNQTVYLWRMPEMDTLFLPAINRPMPPLTVLSGLVETDWHVNPVNLVICKTTSQTCYPCGGRRSLSPKRYF